MYIFLFPLSPTKLIGDFLDCSVPSPFLISYIFSDWNNKRTASMTGQLERWKTRMAGKPERSDSRNYMRKARTTGLIPAPLDWRNDDPCAIRRCGLNSLRGQLTISDLSDLFFGCGHIDMPFSSQLGNSHGKWDVPVHCAFPIVEKITYYFGQYYWAKRKHNFYMKTACSIGKRKFIDRHGPRPLLSNGHLAEPPLFFIVHYLSRIIS